MDFIKEALLYHDVTRYFYWIGGINTGRAPIVTPYTYSACTTNDPGFIGFNIYCNLCISIK